MKCGTSDLERVSFAAGQRLVADDLQAALDYESRLEALHVRGLHDTWGIAEGLDVWIDEVDGRYRVKVEPGIAYDTCGHLIRLQGELSLDPPPLPTCPGWASCSACYDLVIRYAETAELISGQVPRVAGPGPSTCPGPILEQPAWRWVFASGEGESPYAPIAKDVQLGIEIPLTRVLVSMPEPAVELVRYDLRRNARRMIRPHIAGAHLERGSLAVEGNAFAWSVVIDTSAGGFSRTPHYFVTLAEHPLKVQLEALGDDLAWFARYVLGPFIYIHEESRDAFRLTVWFAFPRLPQKAYMAPVGQPPCEQTIRDFIGASGNVGIQVFPPPSNDQITHFCDILRAILAAGSIFPAVLLPALDWLGVESATGCHESATPNEEAFFFDLGPGGFDQLWAGVQPDTGGAAS